MIGVNSALCHWPTMTEEQQKIAHDYSPFRDRNSPDYLKYGKPLRPPKVRVFRKVYRDTVIEWRGHVPIGEMNFSPTEVLEVCK